jgi:hypothetical protein
LARVPPMSRERIFFRGKAAGSWMRVFIDYILAADISLGQYIISFANYLI